MPGRYNVDFVVTPLPAVVAQAYFMTRDKIKEMEEPLRRAAELVSEDIRMNFDVEGRPIPWAELKPGTIDRKAAQGLDPRILRATEALYEGATDPGTWEIAQQGTEWVAVLPDPTGYGHFHLDETTFTPIRDWAYISDETVDGTAEVFDNWLNEIYDSTGL